MPQSHSPKLSPGLPRGAQTVTNKFPTATGAPIKDTNLRNMEGLQTVRVANMTNSPSFAKSFGSFFTSVNKSVSSAFNSIMLFQQQDFSAGLKPEHVQPPPPAAAAGVGGVSVDPPPSYSTTMPVGSRPISTPDIHAHPAAMPMPVPSAAAAAATGPFTNVNTPSLRPTTGGGHIAGSTSMPNTHVSNPVICQNPTRSRSPSPRRGPGDVGFSAAVTNIVDQAHVIVEQDRRPSFRHKSKSLKNVFKSM